MPAIARPIRRPSAATAIPLVLITLAALTGTSASAQTLPVCDQRAPAFREPIRLGTGQGYEPGIETDSKGTIYVMAHKLSLVAEGDGADTRTASWMWRSVDGGVTFQEMAGHGGATELAFAFEGDGAVDANDRFYYVDTWAGDNHFSRWSDRGATMETWRPLVPSVEADDRPWIAAHHDGSVYYMSNSVNSATGRLVVHRSTDRGQSFDPVGFSFPDSLWGFLDADPNSDYVYAFMDETNSDDMVAWVSPDRGLTWTKRKAGVHDEGPASDLGFPAVAVSPVDGSVYGVWSDGENKIQLGRSTDHGRTWTEYDVTPFAGRFAFPWVTVGPTGDVGLIFAGDPADPAAGSGTFVYGMVWRPTSDCLRDPSDPGSACTGPSGAFARLQTASTGSLSSQADFIQIEFTPDNALNAPFEASGNRIMYTRQTAGPNMDGTPICGLVGTP